MPRFYFHVRIHSDVVADTEGANFVDLDAARAEALASACDLAAEELRVTKASALQAIEMADESGSVLETFAVETILK